MLRESPIGNLNIPIWNTGNTDEIFTGSCFESGSMNQLLIR